MTSVSNAAPAPRQADRQKWAPMHFIVDEIDRAIPYNALMPEVRVCRIATRETTNALLNMMQAGWSKEE